MCMMVLAGSANTVNSYHQRVNLLISLTIQVVGLLLPNQTFGQMIFWQVSIEVLLVVT